MDKIHEVVPMDQQPELLQKLSEGNFTLRIMYEQFQNLLKMGPIGQVCRLPNQLHRILFIDYFPKYRIILLLKLRLLLVNVFNFFLLNRFPNIYLR